MKIRKKDLAYQAIKKMVLAKELNEGEYISENSLAQKLDVSRTPVREALLRLQAEGFISIIPNRGALINSVSVVEAKEIYDLRMAIEEFVLRNVFERLTPEHLKRLKVLLTNQETACREGNIEKYLVADAKFHDFFLELYANKMILESVRQVRQRFLAIGVNVLATQSDMAISLEHHEKLFQSLEENNIEQAAQFLHDHLCFGKTNLLR